MKSIYKDRENVCPACGGRGAFLEGLIERYSTHLHIRLHFQFTEVFMNRGRAGGCPENMRPLRKGDPRAVELGRLGAQKREENRQKRKTMKEDLNILLKLALKRGDLVYAEDIQNLAEVKGMNISVQTAIDVAMVQRAMMGDVQAAQYIRDTVGEKPTDKVEVDASQTIEAWAKSHKVKL